MTALPFASSVFLGWALGANDSANVFGTAVASRVITHRSAALLCGLAVIAGAYFQGEAGMRTYRELAVQNPLTISIVSLAAATTVSVMTMRRLPISASQAVVGAIAGIGLATDTMNWNGLITILICWAITPLGAMFFSCLLYFLLSTVLTKIPMSILTRDKILFSGLLITGTYGAFALGANNVANVTGVFSQQFTNYGLSDRDLALLGGVSIALGSVTYSKRIMLAVGSGIMRLDAFTGLVAVTSMALTVHIFATLGVPVSTSQGIVGAIVGIGLVRRTGAIRIPMLKRVAGGWLITPIISLILSAAGHAIFVR